MNQKSKLKKAMVGGVMILALTVPMVGANAGVKSTTGWHIAAYNATETSSLYEDGEYLGMLKVQSTGSQSVSTYTGSKIKCKVYAGKSASQYHTKTQTATSVKQTYDYKGAAYGKAEHVD